MSHAWGAVRFESNGLIKFYEYNGTADICNAQLYNTYKEVWDNWRKYKFIECKCGKDEDIEIYTSYGGGFYWGGKGCRHCNAITKHLEPCGTDVGTMFVGFYKNDTFWDSTNGTPDWVKNLELNK